MELGADSVATTVPALRRELQVTLDIVVAPCDKVHEVTNGMLDLASYEQAIRDYRASLRSADVGATLRFWPQWCARNGR
jgi:hypothetical protein